MSRAHVILFGNFNGERTECVSEAAREFGWKTLTVRHMDEMAVTPEPVAVLVNLRTLGDTWQQTLAALKAALPYTCILVCLGFGERIDWVDLREAGAFDSLHLPFAEAEVRQTLGFVSSSQQAGYLSHLVWLTANVRHAERSREAAEAAGALSPTIH